MPATGIERAIGARYLGSALDKDAFDEAIDLFADPYVASLQLLLVVYSDMVLAAADVNMAGDASANFTENLRHLERRIAKLTQTCQGIEGLSTDAQELVDSQKSAEKPKMSEVSVAQMSVIGGRRS